MIYGRIPNQRGENVTRRARVRHWLIRKLAMGDAIVANVEVDGTYREDVDTTMRPYRGQFLLVSDCRFIGGHRANDPDTTWILFTDSRQSEYEHAEGFR